MPKASLMIRAIISDFDGTLCDTFEANFRAYAEAFEKEGMQLTREKYRECFGLRFDNFMERMNVADEDVKRRIRLNKGECYPNHFSHFVGNDTLLRFISDFHNAGGKTAVASTARRKNLMNALHHLDAEDIFDLILAGEDVTHGKPDPEIYLKAAEKLGVRVEECLVFEDSDVGLEAARRAGMPHIKIKKQ